MSRQNSTKFAVIQQNQSKYAIMRQKTALCNNFRVSLQNFNKKQRNSTFLVSKYHTNLCSHHKLQFATFLNKNLFWGQNFAIFDKMHQKTQICALIGALFVLQMVQPLRRKMLALLAFTVVPPISKAHKLFVKSWVLFFYQLVFVATVISQRHFAG